jgi:hypothetical protein
VRERVVEQPALRRAGAVERLGEAASLIGRGVRLVTTVGCLFILVGIVLVLADANASNHLVRWVLDRSRELVGPFHDVFITRTRKGEVFKNWGLALLGYYTAGRILSRLLGHRPS